MGSWLFKSLLVKPDGAPELVELNLAQLRRIPLYAEALRVAADSLFQNRLFPVTSCARYWNGWAGVPAGNIEYGLCQALHGEESAVAASRSRFSRFGWNSTEDFVLGFSSHSNGDSSISPCGNCRDILLEEFGAGLEIVAGAGDGGLAVVSKLSDYLFDSPRELIWAEIPPYLVDSMLPIILDAEGLANDAYSPKNTCPERRYHALLMTKSGVYVGARDVMCDYHPVYALYDAVRQARRARDPFVRLVVVFCEECGSVPQVMYKDRQHLFELNLQGELVSGTEADPPVFLLTYAPEDKRVLGVSRASVKMAASRSRPELVPIS